MYEHKNLSIKSWAENDRPREKFARLGRRSLTNTELLAIILGSGNKSESAVTLSQRILADGGNKVGFLHELSIAKLKKYKGIGNAKAISLLAAVELGRRMQNEVSIKPQNYIELPRSSGTFKTHFFRTQPRGILDYLFQSTNANCRNTSN